MSAVLRVVDIEPRLVACVRASVPFADIPQAQRAARRALAEALAQAGLPEGQTLTVWRPPAGGTIDYAPGVFVPARFEAPDAISFVTLPSGRAAHLVYEGPYEGLAQAWQRLFEACGARGLTPSGLNWEVYAGGEPAPATELYAALM